MFLPTRSPFCVYAYKVIVVNMQLLSPPKMLPAQKLALR